ncbi:MAG: fructosamine kinase family protein [Bifidobacteriaceae bacterium]|nr:fructosamine kinase family protein [Bifidobacteriaceae bacterium]
MSVYRKSRSNAPAGFFECEAKGLLWLKQAESLGGPHVANVIGWEDDYLDIDQIDAVSPDAESAYEFGRQLARMHDSGAESFGAAPAGYSGTCYFGPLQDPVPMATGAWDNAVQYFAEGRLVPMVRMGIERGILTAADLRMTNRLIERIPEILGNAAQDKPARIHGDLWSGNVMWTSDESGKTHAVLIDPAAHGGHREEDLAMLELFGSPYMKETIDGYLSVHPLKEGYERRFRFWQLYPIAGHCVFFAGSYVNQFRTTVDSYL